MDNPVFEEIEYLYSESYATTFMNAVNAFIKNNNDVELSKCEQLNIMEVVIEALKTENEFRENKIILGNPHE